MSKPRRPQPPEGLQVGGRSFWEAILEKFELVDHELVILKEESRTIDLLDSLQMIIDGMDRFCRAVTASRTHPAGVDLRQHRIKLARLLAALGIPSDDEDRPATRGRSCGLCRMDGRS
jgi:hypothetical protein